jgi:hypothetical protein
MTGNCPRTERASSKLRVDRHPDEGGLRLQSDWLRLDQYMRRGAAYRSYTPVLSTCLASALTLVFSRYVQKLHEASSLKKMPPQPLPDFWNELQGAIFLNFFLVLSGAHAHTAMVSSSQALASQKLLLVNCRDLTHTRLSYCRSQTYCGARVNTQSSTATAVAWPT